jgi:thioredoxin 1
MRKIKGYGSKNCIFCQKMQPVLIELFQEGLIDIEFNELTGNEQLFFDLGIQKYPTLIFFDENGNEYRRIEGQIPREKILEYFNEVL